MGTLIAVVTGASRGIGKGIALALGRAGAVVYITGRTLEHGEAPWPGSTAETAAHISQLGGQGIAVACDHHDDAQVAAVMARIRADHGRLDLLVNNASAFGQTPDGYPLEDTPFWLLPTAQWDEMYAVGVRSHFVAAALAAPLMVSQRSGLIVNISSPGAVTYAFNAGYGAAKAAVDKLSADMAQDLRPYDVSVVSLWPPFTRTEKYLAQVDHVDLSGARPPEFTGKVVAALATDPKVREKSGRALRVTDLASEYEINE
jgi:dehydrogenase/reductase SDR family protein 1